MPPKASVSVAADNKNLYLIIGILAGVVVCGIGWAVVSTMTTAPPADQVANVQIQHVPIEPIVNPVPPQQPQPAPQPSFQSRFADIFEAAKSGTVQDIEYFIKNRVNVNARDNNGMIPLHFAAEHNPNVEVVRYLISQGADVSAGTRWGTTPIHFAAQNRNVAIRLVP